MPKSDSVATGATPLGVAWLAMVGLVVTPGSEDSQTDKTISAATAKASRGEGSQSQKLRGARSAAMRARKHASNAGDGEISGRPSSALHTAWKPSTRERHAAQTPRCSSTA